MFGNKKAKKIIHTIWVIIAVMVTVSMVMLYIPGVLN
jgi:hypothetical protein